jgi:hypothetical protein
MLQQMDREFEKIFGIEASAAISPARGKAGDPVRRNESSPRIGSGKSE